MIFIPSRHRAWLAYAAVTLFYCRPVFSGRFLFSGGDTLRSIYSSMVYFHEWTAQGIVPLWNTLSACGAPFGATSITTANLYYLTAAVLDAGAAYNAVMIASLFLNGVLLYEFLLKRGRSDFAAWIGGLIWMITTSRAIDSGFFALTLSFLMAEIYSVKKSRSAYLLLVGVLAFYALNAQAQYFLYGGLFLGCYLFSRTGGRSSNLRTTLTSCALPFFLALGLSAPHWARLAEWTLVSNRSSWAVVQAWLPTHYPLVVFPKLYQLAGRPDLEYIVPRMLQWFFSQIPPLRSLERVIEPSYMGLWAVFGVLAALHHSRREKKDPDRFFLGAAAFTVLYLLFHPVLYLGFIRHVPVLSGMTNVGRLFEVYQFSLSVLAAGAVDFLFQHGPAAQLFFRKLVRRSLVMLGFFAVSLGSIRVLAVANEAWIRQKIEAGLRALNTSTIFIENVGEFQSRRVDEFFIFIRSWASPSNLHLELPVALATLLGFLVYGFLTRRISKTVFKGFLVVFIAVDLGMVLGFEMRSSDPADLRRHDAVVELLKRDRELFRVMIVEDKTRSFSKFFLAPQSNMIYGIATPDAYEPLYLRRYVEFYSRLTKRGDYPVGHVMHPMHQFDDALADRINIKYLFTTAHNDLLEGRVGYEKIFEDGEDRVYRNSSARPRAFWTPSADLVPGEADDAHAGVEITRYEPNRMDMEVRSEKAGVVFMSETYYPGWTARLDGEPVTILPADGVFRAVAVPRGEHKLSLTYQPRSLWIGGILSLVSLLGLLIFSKMRA